MYSLKILQNWTRDLFHSSILMFENKSYLFNCSDGTQRNALDQSIKFFKIENIFFNSSHIDAYLGTFGFYMSRNEQVAGQLIAHANINENQNKTEKHKELLIENIKNFGLWGPPNFTKNFDNVKHFFFDDIKKMIYEYTTEESCFLNISELPVTHFEDENVKIFPICTWSNVPGNNLNNQNINMKDFAMSYICEPHLKKPTFLADKAKGLGLKPGPIYKLLQNGNSIVLENGTVIKPEDVLSTQPPCACVGIFYSPTIQHALHLTQQEIIKSYVAKSDKRNFSLVIHIISNISIIENDFYREFISSFGENTIHILDCKETNFKFMLNPGKQKIKFLLSKIDEDLFKHDIFTDEDTLPKKCMFEVLGSDYIKNNKIIHSSPGFDYLLYPTDKAKIIQDKIYFDPYIYKNTNFNKFSDVVEKIITETKNDVIFNKNIFRLNNSNNNPTTPEITFLGTTSMKPGKFRNVSSILIKLSAVYNNYGILLDCGEGTFQQIFEHFGNKQTDEIISKLKVIFITHKHGDHMLGVLKILSEIDKLKHISGFNSNEPPTHETIVYIVAPKTIRKWLTHSINRHLIYRSHIILIDCASINPNRENVYTKYINQLNPYDDFKDVPLFNNIEIITNNIKNFHQMINSSLVSNFYAFINKFLGVNIYSIEVFHCDESYGCVVEELSSNNNPWKISYSGDTRPCNNFYNYSINSSILIHEATFDDELKNDAIKKMHSTFDEAINIGIHNKSNKIILTHFSPRYGKHIDWKPIYDEYKILLAHDFLTVKLSDLEWAYYYTKIFSTVMDKLNDKIFEDIFT